MTKYKLGEIVNKINDKIDKDSCELKYYIGGEHFDSGEVSITKKAEILGSTIGPAFHMRFKPGHVLLMSRNPHLRKAGVVDFEGICSNVSYVLETKDSNILLQEFLPFILQTDSFWEFASANKKGSTNFFLNWKDFANYEFNLPSIEEQEELSKILWAAEKLREEYRNIVNSIDDAKFAFIESISSRCELIELERVFKLFRGKGLNKSCIVANGKNKCILYGELFTKYGVQINEVISETDIEKDKMILSKKGDVLIPGTDVTPNGLATASAIMIDDVILGGDINILRPKVKCSSIYISYVINHYKNNIIRNVTGTNIKHISCKALSKIKYPIPKLEYQEFFCNKLIKMDNLKKEITKKSVEILNIQKAIINGGQS